MAVRNLAVKGKKILVVGLGVSGFWTSRWLAEHGAEVTVTDNRRQEEVSRDFCEELRSRGVAFEFGGHHRKTFLSADMIIVSPGVPHTMSAIQEAQAKGIPLMGELELAGRIIKTPLIG
ncbi:MAG: UDP-N-acetylmuramoyl-L-alanine--D-glutamate ligase, partial [Deltaproteobacteria bacterium]